MDINEQISIPRDELVFTFARSGGPGGQNVNKVNTKVTLHWDVQASDALPEDVRDRFLDRYRNRINKDGQLVLYSQRYRDQGKNVDDCQDKLREFVLTVLSVPKARKKTRPSRNSVRRRLDNKRKKGEKKQSRRKDWGRD